MNMGKLTKGQRKVRKHVESLLSTIGYGEQLVRQCWREYEIIQDKCIHQFVETYDNDGIQSWRCKVCKSFVAYKCQVSPDHECYFWADEDDETDSHVTLRDGRQITIEPVAKNEQVFMRCLFCKTDILFDSFTGKRFRQ